MAEQAGSLERLALEFAHVLRRIAGRLSDEKALDTFEELGVRFPDEFLTEPAIRAARTTIITVTAELDTLIVRLGDAIEGGDAAAMAAAGLALLTQCGRVGAAFPELAGAIQSRGPTLPGITPAQIAELVDGLPGKLTDLLVADLLELSSAAAAVLAVFGVLERTFQPGTSPSRPPHERLAVHLDRLLPAITDPAGHLRELYGWGTAGFDALRFLTVLEGALGRLGLPVLLIPPGPGTPPRLQMFALDLTPTPDGTGLAVEVVLPGSLDTEFEFPVSPPTWTARIAVHGALAAATQGSIRPPFHIELTPPSGRLDATFTVGLRAAPDSPFLVLGQAGGSRLEFGAFSLDAGVALGFDTATGRAVGGPALKGEVTGGRLVIDVGSGDGFIATVLGGARIESAFDVGFAFDPVTGLRFDGSGALEVSLPVHIELGPVEVQAIHLLAKIAGRTVPLELSAGLSISLGPIKGSVDRLGVLVELGFPEGGGNLGPADLGFAFKPPNGVGLSIDVGILTGGGYLNIDPERGEYSGTLELELAGFLAIKALGLITTRMPDGSKGFSLLLVLTAEFAGGGLQLGYGFRLLAVGGLVGLNRTMRLDALAEGVRSGAIESVMFPTDVVANAPRILSDLRAFFPPQEGRFLIGPMLKIGWGTPTLISVSVGVIIEIPGSIAIVGVLKVALPVEEAPIIVLQVNFLGAVEPDKQRLWFFASLFESRVLTITIDGEMGILIAWGDNPNLVLTVGGFHPSYTPPPLPFPAPRRVSFDLLNSGIGRITVSGYFAVTSNTAQFGARAEMYFGFSAISLKGHIAFDALFRFSPFSFLIQISASVSLRVFGVGVFSIRLAFSLEGPTPWRARGRGSISFFFFDVSADFDITWGEERDTALPAVDVLPILAAEFAKLEGWRTFTPGGAGALVSLRQLPDSEDDLILHPLGTLFVRQRAVPLDLRLDKIGSQRPRDVGQVSVTVAGSGLIKRADVDEQFALAQFQEMDDAAKLSRRPYEPQHGGVELAADGGAIASSRALRRSARYEQIIVDTVPSPAPERFVNYPAGLFTHLLNGNSVSRSVLAKSQADRRQPFQDTIRMSGERFSVASVRDNIALGESFGSETAARDDLAARVAANPRLAGTLHVIPSVEQRVVVSPE
ncbi:DUF6603 domain-containing protein [Rhizohabitans arisaemae]|uniref:DUF6603 domain-containing protein n=1 Tax=Rhizohabitans arisaemae TaxID=2720610 RepID=UPI0024B09634|nr:DUF6603 domain-containing protein [Rhizohabitans arisaemae]